MSFLHLLMMVHGSDKRLLTPIILDNVVTFPLSMTGIRKLLKRKGSFRRGKLVLLAKPSAAHTGCICRSAEASRQWSSLRYADPIHLSAMHCHATTDVFDKCACYARVRSDSLRVSLYTYHQTSASPRQYVAERCQGAARRVSPGANLVLPVVSIFDLALCDDRHLEHQNRFPFGCHRPSIAEVTNGDTSRSRPHDCERSPAARMLPLTSVIRNRAVNCTLSLSWTSSSC
ncbi:hypothetical protein C8Q74DRAFT_1227862 [Fomes fomentarius]|nr:hypothetical protein C8Q74DRAFT_1227862 [Fomes fomentarius]